MVKVVESFFGSSNLRGDLLADVEAEGLLSTLWLQTSTSGSVTELFALEYHVDRSLFKLLAVLAGSHLDETSRAFLTKALEAIPLDRPSDGIVARWLLEVCVPAVAARLAGTAAADVLDTIIALVQRSGAEAVDEKEWHSARRAMIFVEGITPLQAAYAEVATAMAWDLSRYPTAIADVFHGWQESVRREVLLSDGWTDEIEADFNKMMREAHDRVGDAIRERIVAGEDLPEDYRDEMLQDHFEADGKLDHYLRANRLHSEAQAAVEEWHSQRQSEYLRFAGAEAVQ